MTTVTVKKTTVAELTDANRHVRESAHAVGVALSSVSVYTEPAVARAVQAEHNLYARISTEFGMLTSTEAGKRMGSRSSAPRNLATTAHRNKALVAVRRMRGRETHRPGQLSYAQFGLLFGLAGTSGCSARALADHADLSPATVTRCMTRRSM